MSPNLHWNNSYDICQYLRIFPISAEDRADALIQDLISSTKVSKSPQEILKEMEAERKQMEEQFTIRAGEADKLREQDVLSKSKFSHQNVVSLRGQKSYFK